MKHTLIMALLLSISTVIQSVVLNEGTWRTAVNQPFVPNQHTNQLPLQVIFVNQQLHQENQALERKIDRQTRWINTSIGVAVFCAIGLAYCYWKSNQ